MMHTRTARRHLLPLTWLLTIGLLAGCDGNREPRVIFFIGDGVGVGYWTAALFTADSLAIEAFPVLGLVDTRADPQIVTDSAAAATALACGVRTYNGAIGVDAEERELTSVLEVAEARGAATGLVATSSLTHATPAAFAAHVARRSMENEIAEQMAASGIEVLLGGGRRRFARAPESGGTTLLDQLRATSTCVTTAGEFRALDLARTDRLVGLFANGHMPAAAEREPDLAEMTAAALAILDRDPDGFFLMVEGSQPDWRGHDNEPLAEMMAEMLDFDRAIRAGLAYRADHPGTLIIVTADHETGGLAVEGAGEGGIRLDYTTGGHTAELVPLFAIGPGAERFAGLTSSDAIGRELLAIFRR